MPGSILPVEYDLVASLLADPTQLLAVADLRPDAFADPGLAVVYDAIRRSGGRFTPATLAHDLAQDPRQRQALQGFVAACGQAEPIPVLQMLAEHGVEAGSAAVLAETVRDAAVERDVRRIISETRPNAFGTNAQWAAVLSDRITHAASVTAGGEANTLESGVDAAWDELEDRWTNPETIPGLRVNLGDLDRVTGGLQGGQLIMIGGATGEGKAQPYHSLVVTPSGPVPIGSLRVGDRVSNPTGEPSEVTAVFEQGEIDTYRVTFEDGSSTLCGAPHLWFVDTTGFDRRRWPHGEDGPGRVVDTLELMAMAEHGQRTGRLAPQVPLTEPVEFDRDPELPLDPYLLGLLLGDGCFIGSQPGLTSPEPEVAEFLARHLGPETYRHCREIQFVFRKRTGIKEALEHLGLWGHRSEAKFVPSVYLTSRLEDRWALVNGLMDTDGYVDTLGRCSYDTTSDRLAADMAWLLRSLGYAVRHRVRQTAYTSAAGERVPGQPCHHLTVSGPNKADLFRLPRKRGRCRDSGKAWHKVVSVEPAGRERCRCIMVSHPNRLYLTDDFVVTHNSLLLSHMCLEAVQTRADRDGRWPRAAFFSLEMSAKSLANRFISKLAMLGTHVRDPDEEQRGRIRVAAETLRGLAREQRLVLVEPGRCRTVEQISREIVRLRQTSGLDVAFIDYAQLVDMSGAGEMALHDKYGKIAERLKLLSLQVDIPIVMAVQLNRESMTTHPTAKPAQHQVAGSHQLLNTADAMYLVWRPARHITWEVGPWANIAVLLTPKRRDGEECGDLYFATRRNVCHFEPVPEAVRKELAGPEAQAILNGRNKGGY